MTRYYSSVASEKELVSPVDGSATTISVDDTTGLPAQYPYTLILDRDTASEEIVSVTSAAGTLLTVTRGEDGSVGVSHEAGASVVHGITARDLQESRDHEDASTNVHGVGSGNSVVGTATTQSLSNKTLDGDLNTFQNVPQTAVTDLVDDQAAQDARLTSSEGNISSLTSDLSNHENSVGEHGVSEIVGRTEAQTLTNKTIDGDDNTFENVPQGGLKRGILYKNAHTGGATRAPDTVGFLATWEAVHAITPGGGSWGAGSGGHSSQWTHPVTGLYEIHASWEFGRGGPRDQVGPIDLEFMRDMTAGDSTSGTQITEVEQGYIDMPSVNTLHLSILYEVTSTSSIHGLRGRNLGDDDITTHVAGTHLHVKYLGPA